MSTTYVKGLSVPYSDKRYYVVWVKGIVAGTHRKKANAVIQARAEGGTVKRMGFLTIDGVPNLVPMRRPVVTTEKMDS